MSSAQVFNWERGSSTVPAKRVRATSEDHIREIVRNAEDYPTPVRAVGSMHSPTRCWDADGGTLIDMSALNQIKIADDRRTVTAGAGASYGVVARKLGWQKLQFEVNTEIGNLSLGSAAVAGTKDASMVDSQTGEMRPGQVGSFVTRVRLVDHRGEVEVIEDEARLREIRSSYGLFGIVTEVTLEVKPVSPISVEHRRYTLDGFRDAFPDLIKYDRRSMFMYMFPFRDRVVVEFRGETGARRPGTTWPWTLRNFCWGKLIPGVGTLAERWWLHPPSRYALLDRWYGVVTRVLDYVLEASRAAPTAQIVDFPKKGGIGRFSFSFWAFPEARYTEILGAYFAFCRDHLERFGYRPNLPHVSYRIAKDDRTLLSYSSDGPVMTLDPAATPSPGFEVFQRRFNDFAIDHGGKPLFNQTKWLSAEIAARAYGERWVEFARLREEKDPEGRFLSAHFKALLPKGPPVQPKAPQPAERVAAE